MHIAKKYDNAIPVISITLLRLKIPITNAPINIQFEINACLLFSLANIFDKNIKPKLLGINAMR